MPRSITCPRCSTVLSLPAGAGEALLTCPRCLAAIPAPSQQGITAAPSNIPVLETVCPACGESVGPNWRYCPSCQESLRGRNPRGRRRSVELDVRRDNTTVSVFMILLATLGGIGVVLMLLTSVTSIGEGDYTFVVWVFAGLFAFGLIGSLTVVFSKTQLDTGRALGLAAYRSLALAGILVLLCCLTCVAAGIYGLAVCLQDFR